MHQACLVSDTNALSFVAARLFSLYFHLTDLSTFWKWREVRNVFSTYSQGFKALRGSISLRGNGRTWTRHKCGCGLFQSDIFVHSLKIEIGMISINHTLITTATCSSDTVMLRLTLIGIFFCHFSSPVRGCSGSQTGVINSQLNVHVWVQGIL